MSHPILQSRPEDAERYRLAWAEYPADLSSPVRLFLTLRAAGHHACLLESAEGPTRLARYTFLAVNPRARFRSGRNGSSVEGLSQASALPRAPQHALRELARGLGSTASAPSLPPFRGGWIGWFAYEWASTLEPTVGRAESDSWNVPDATFDLYEDVIAFDHAGQKLYIMAACQSGARDYAAAMGRIEQLAEALNTGRVESGALQSLAEAPRACWTREQFCDGVERLQHEIARGEIFQAVLSQRLEFPVEGDPFTLYRVLRLTNPSPHMFFFEADGLTLIGSSPERLVSVVRGRAQLVPIAGTRPRHEDPDQDKRLAAELRGDQKELAEHDMLVDLARNDLGRVARIGSVRVKEHASLEQFARVQHLVSRVECELASGFDALDALAAAFPAGTVSGAPKIRALQLLAQIESSTRGPYAGAFGYVDGSGNLDMCIAIRTLVVRGGIAHLQAGAGIVFDSKPELEYQETLHKSNALLEAIRLASAPAFQPACRQGLQGVRP